MAVLNAAMLASAASVSASAQDGVIVEEVAKGSAGQTAGLASGDLLLSWSRGAESGRINSPFVLSDVQLEQGSRGPVTLTGRHGAAAHVWVLGPGNWGLTVRPLFTPELQEIYEEERRAFESGQSGGAAEQWRVVAAQTRDPAWLTG
jgi:hypothetical protein